MDAKTEIKKALRECERKLVGIVEKHTKRGPIDPDALYVLDLVRNEPNGIIASDLTKRLRKEKGLPFQTKRKKILEALQVCGFLRLENASRGNERRYRAED